MIRLFLICLTVLSLGCSGSNSTSFEGEAMTIAYTVKIGKILSSEQSKQVSNIIQNTFEEIDTLYNKWNPNSELSFLNQSKAYERIPISKSLEAFFKTTTEYVDLTERRFDPTVESAQKIWKDAFKTRIAPSEQARKNALQAIGWSKIHIENGVFWKENDNLEIDLGGIAKGYAIDLITERLNEAGFSDVYVEWGGEIRTSGIHPENRPWRVCVSSFGSLDPACALAIIDLKDEAIASSGDYLQNWSLEGTTYFHIFDPKTGLPLIATEDTVASATVVAESCMLADVLATASMQFKTCEEAESWLEGLKGKVPRLQYWLASRRHFQGRQEKNPISGSIPTTKR